MVKPEQLIEIKKEKYKEEYFNVNMTTKGLEMENLMVIQKHKTNTEKVGDCRDLCPCDTVEV